MVNRFLKIRKRKAALPDEFYLPVLQLTSEQVTQQIRYYEQQLGLSPAPSKAIATVKHRKAAA